MPNTIRDIRETIVDDENNLLFEKNVSVPLKEPSSVIRCNVYRPKGDGKYPGLITYGPYGKDIYYGEHVSQIEPLFFLYWKSYWSNILL